MKKEKRLIQLKKTLKVVQRHLRYWLAKKKAIEKIPFKSHTPESERLKQKAENIDYMIRERGTFAKNLKQEIKRLEKKQKKK